MKVFVVIALDQENIEAMVSSAFDDRHMIANHTWLVAQQGVRTSSEVFAKLYEKAENESVESPRTRTLIVPIPSYYGYGNVATWQWIDSRRES